MDWKRPYKATYSCKVLDRGTGVETGEIEVLSCSVSLSEEGVGMSASIETPDAPPSCPIVRIDARAEQNGEVETVPLFTGYAHCTGKSWETDRTYEMEGEGLLAAADALEVDVGFTVPARSQRAEAAATLIRRAIPRWSTVRVAGESPRLADALVAEEGETCLSMAEKLLSDCKWHIRRLGDGDFEIAPTGAVVATIDVEDNDVLMPDITDQRDLYEAVSVYRAIAQNGSSVVVRDEEIIEAVGFERWHTERNVSLSEGQTLLSYAMEQMAETNDFSRDVSWTREYIPGICCGDTIRAAIVSRGIEGRYRSKTMDIECGAGVTVDEVVVEHG